MHENSIEMHENSIEMHENSIVILFSRMLARLLGWFGVIWGDLG